MINNDNQATDQEFERTLEKRPTESAEFYERRKNDPLDFYSPIKGTERARLIELDERGLAAARARRDSHEALEFAADLARLRFLEGGDVDAAVVETILAGETILEERGVPAVARLRAQAQLIDVESLSSFGHFTEAAQKADSITDPTERKRAKQALEHSIQQTTDLAIKSSAEVLREAHSSFKSVEGGGKEWQIEERKALVGVMFEQLYATYRRLEVNAAEANDQVLVQSAGQFQDDAAKHYEPQNHNFDLMEFSSTGNITKIIQCKAAEVGDYHESIQPVRGLSYSRFLENPEKFIRAIEIVAANSVEVTESDMKSAMGLLKSLFERDHRAIANSGTKAAVEL